MEQTDWIPVTYNLPRHYENVLVCDEGGAIYVASLNAYSQGEFLWEDNYGYYQDDIVAWMPLPEPYEGE